MRSKQKYGHLTINQSGYSLVGVLLLIVLLSVLGLGLLAFTSNSVKTSTGERSDQSAFYIAEAAVTLEFAEIQEKVNQSYKETANEAGFYSSVASKIVTNGTKASPAVFQEASGERPRAEITVIKSDSPDLFKIISTGIIGTKKRTVEQEFYVPWLPKSGGTVPQLAAFVKETITVKNGTITGSIGTLMKEAGSIILEKGKGSITDIFVPLGSEKIAIKSKKGTLTATGKDMGAFPQLPPFPAFPSLPLVDRNLGIETVKLMESKKFRDINVKNGTLTIDTGSGDKAIVMDNIYLHNGNIKVTGTGNLSIYVKGQFTIDGGNSSINNGGNVSQVNLFLKGSGTSNPKIFKLNGSIIHASLYAEDANIELENNGEFKGNLFTGGTSITFRNGQTKGASLILAPNADFKHDQGTITGSIITKSYSITSGSAKLNYQPMQYTTGPISVEGLGNGGQGTRKIEISKKPLREK